MRENQKGVSMISLVITIIVMIILAAVAFGSSQETISQATFANFQTNMDTVQGYIDQKVTLVRGGDFLAKGDTITNEQALNLLAKGATVFFENSGDDLRDTILPRGVAAKLAATQISGDTAKKLYEKELPVMTVNTYNATKVPVSYFVTREGKVFIWPPYYNDADKQYYVNNDTPVSLETATNDAYKGIVKNDNEEQVEEMYTKKISFKVGDVEVYVDNTTDEAPEMSVANGVTYNNEGLAEFPVVYFKDVTKTKSPVGAEAAKLYSAKGDEFTGTTTP